MAVGGGGVGGSTHPVPPLTTLSRTCPPTPHPTPTHRDVDFWEVNEAFSVVDLVNQKLLGLEATRCVW